MAISFECRQCGKKLRAPDHAAGKNSKCPACGAKVMCPETAASGQVPRKSAAAPATAPVKAAVVDPYADDGNPYALEEPDPVPEPMPARTVSEESGSTLKKPKGKKGAKRAYLKSIAVSQKGVLISLLLQILFNVSMFASNGQMKIFSVIAVLLVALIGTVFTFMLAIKVYSVGLGVFLGILTLVPFVSLIVLLVVSGKATKILRESGHDVGLMGAKLSEF
jgi:DNA-directed RNA polymerase subunit RPC12/RpoP